MDYTSCQRQSTSFKRERSKSRVSNKECSSFETANIQKNHTWHRNIAGFLFLLPCLDSFLALVTAFLASSVSLFSEWLGSKPGMTRAGGPEASWKASHTYSCTSTKAANNSSAYHRIMIFDPSASLQGCKQSVSCGRKTRQVMS
jgi:hypothetical protein